MNNFLKAVLYSAAAAGVAAIGWRLARGLATTPAEHPSSSNGDLGGGGAGPLTREQREKLLEELEDQLDI